MFGNGKERKLIFYLPQRKHVAQYPFVLASSSRKANSFSLWMQTSGNKTTVITLPTHSEQSRVSIKASYR